MKTGVAWLDGLGTCDRCGEPLSGNGTATCPHMNMTFGAECVKCRKSVRSTKPWLIRLWVRWHPLLFCPGIHFGDPL